MDSAFVVFVVVVVILLLLALLLGVMVDGALLLLGRCFFQKFYPSIPPSAQQ